MPIHQDMIDLTDQPLIDEQRYMCIAMLRDNPLICDIAGRKEFILVPPSELTDEDGKPTFNTMRFCHDRYWHLHNLWTRQQYEGMITHYGAFAEAALLVRQEVRKDYAAYILEQDPEHPDVTELIRLHRFEPQLSLNQACNQVMRMRERNV